MHKTLHQSKNYIVFKNQRNLALEKLLLVSKQRIADYTRIAFTDVIKAVNNSYDIIVKHNDHRAVDPYITGIFHNLLDNIYKETIALRKRVYTLSYKAEAEGIRRSLNKHVNSKIRYDQIIRIMKKEDPAGGTVAQRIAYVLTRQKNKIIEAIHLSLMLKETREGMLQRVYDSLPKVKKIPTRVNLKKVSNIKEANKNGPVDFIFTDDETWKSIVDDYKNDYIPQYRGPESSYPSIQGYPEYVTADDEALTYGWQIEQQLTNDFVTLVREGAIESAKDNGISDFMWIAILDDHTCENCCGNYGCADFDGHTLAEVEKMTAGGTQSPPAHFNCRCDIAPIVGDLPTVESNEGEFDSWLNNA